MGNPGMVADTQVGQTSLGVSTDAEGNQGGNQGVIDWEKRYKDTQSAFTKKAQELASLKAKVKILEENAKPVTVVPDDRKDELEDLKYNDPDAWRLEMNKLEEDSLKQINKQIESKTADMLELERRQQVLEEFYAEHPGFVLDDQDIPPRISKKLADGQITFEQFLVESYEYVTKGRKIAPGGKTLGQPNLNKIGGGDSPSQHAQVQSTVQSYKNEIF